VDNGRRGPISQARIATDGNVLIQALPQEERDALVSLATAVPLEPYNVLYDANGSIDSVYFPTEGVASLITVLSDSSGVETGIVGWEGMVGLPVFLGTETMGNVYAIVQIVGRALRVEAAAFRDVVQHAPKLREVLSAYTQAVLSEAAQEVACNRQHSIDERLARWLLMTQDRVQSDEIRLTQDFLARMLGVRRPSVTVAAGILQKAGFIRYRRGRIEVLDREGLAAASCECYRVIRDEFDRFLAEVGSRRSD
jgi:CRP-like cAMP-binding protein